MSVFVAVPSYAGLKCIPFINSLEKTLLLLNERGYGGYFAKQQGCCYIQVSRNELVQRFLDSHCDQLLFLDDDLEWEPKDALRLVECEHDLVAGVYPKKTPTEDYPVVINTDEDGIALTKGGLISAHLLPTGFMKIRRKVIEKLREAYPQQKYIKPDGQEMFDLFPQGVQGGRWWGEDFAFCKLWRDLGGDAWVIPHMTFSHHGQDEQGNPKVWTGSYHDFLCRQPGGSKA